MFYQWHPNHINWGNISWGHATSKDLITWTDVGGWENNQALALGPAGNGTVNPNPANGLTYDGLGIFSGTAQPVNLHGEVDGTLSIFYTSVSFLPTSWSIPYHRGTESVSIAQSHDGGVTWEQYAGNPVVFNPPEGWNVTGWRDPFVHAMPELDTVIGYTEPHYYFVLGSGIKGVGPRMPLYSAPASNLTDWTFLGALWEPADNTTFSTYEKSGSYGFNFEVYVKSLFKCRVDMLTYCVAPDSSPSRTVLVRTTTTPTSVPRVATPPYTTTLTGLSGTRVTLHVVV